MYVSRELRWIGIRITKENEHAVIRVFVFSTVTMENVTIVVKVTAAELESLTRKHKKLERKNTTRNVKLHSISLLS